MKKRENKDRKQGREREGRGGGGGARRRDRERGEGWTDLTGVNARELMTTDHLDGSGSISTLSAGGPGFYLRLVCTCDFRN